MTRASSFSVLLLGFALAALPLRAHNPLQSWLSAVIRPNGLELTLTTAPINALRFLDPDAAGPLTRAGFPELKARLVAIAPKLCLVTGPTKLRVETVEVTFTEENDVAFTLLFTPAVSGTLRFDAAFLRQLGEDFTSMLVVSDAVGNDLGWDNLTTEKPYLDIAVPPRPATPKP
jgi:hypothetical protein